VVIVVFVVLVKLGLRAQGRRIDQAIDNFHSRRQGAGGQDVVV
jgi:hypothetical protein